MNLYAGARWRQGGRMRLVRTLQLSTAVIGLLASAACAPEQAASSGARELTVADFYSDTHSIGVAGVQPYMKLVEKRSGGRLRFDYRTSEQLAAAEDIHHAVRAGAADVGNVLYMGSQNPMMYVPQLPGLYRDRDVVGASQAFWTFVRTNSVMRRTFREWNIKPLFCFTLSNYQMQFSDPSIDSMDDIRGKQLRAAGSILPFSIRAAGATSIDLNAGEAYDAFNRGVIDGLSLSVTSVKDYSFYELIQSAIVDLNLGGFPVCYGMNLDTWNSLPPRDQRVLNRAGDATVSATAAELRRQITEDLAEWRKQGIRVHHAKPGKRFRKRIAAVESEWVDQLVGDGMDRAEVERSIEQWKRLLRAEIGN
ncbi:MAG: hypothetical protein GEU98_01195 [Pseudonocardiaceae bacterium]|nr:hypothetical protein [Pseudonocardiaceae bacterium]